MVAKKSLKAIKPSAKPRKSAPKLRSPTPIVDDVEMSSDINKIENANDEEYKEDEDEEVKKRPAVEVDDDSQDLHDELIRLNQMLIANKLAAEKKKANKTLQDFDGIFDEAEETMIKLETSAKGSKGHRDRVTMLYKAMDQHLKSSKIDVAAVQNEWQELDRNVFQTSSQINEYIENHLGQYTQHLENVITAYNDRSAYLRSASDKGNRIRKRTLDKLRKDDQTDAGILTDMLYRLKGIETV